ncbi:hypothetical protein LOTGIDRAFT_176387 [Lottia gigantea]|uniref:Uncharacterized protein n=1 Tax=Lottia gigantea TaxID=225164 RepID=V4BBL7_LOTGI|nr:hypothetical protein LOTGIDRAFT_176387 [Lottia gigantea]ESP03432.1 hypothetical protein LOTGIDRAFT_176387 [Lottia gigantea]
MHLATRLLECVEKNCLTIEPIPGDNSYPRKCSLTESHKLCNYKIRLDTEDTEWYSISQLCRNRIAAVCDFYTYIRYIQQGLVKSEAELATRLLECVERNCLTIEPIPGDNSYPRKCSLTESHKLCNYKIRLDTEDTEWYSISQLCRNRIAAVCDFYTYIRYIQQGLVKSEGTLAASICTIPLKLRN